MDAMIAFCGLDCYACDAYTATQANDVAALERIAAQWREQFNAPDITAAAIICDGCHAATGRLNGYCGMCTVRACGLSHQVPNCSRCAELDACTVLIPDARARLVEMRSWG